MVVARKKYNPIENHGQQQEKTIKKKKLKRSYRFEKIVLSMGIITVLSLSLMLLTRFATVTEVRHRVNHLNKQLEQLETQKEHLRIEVEKVSKSRWIEREAMERLSMQYPLPEQVVYIHVDPTEIAKLSHQLQYGEEQLDAQNGSGNIFGETLNRFLGLFRI
ncbi:cell division protein FtsL [Clostridium formicaceticum]|uniref:Cell division protein FtsL n=1 Tax=Clostridium formicaceticum TaxID=1497 RepID=A0AAC9WGM9_9CLOT|nr:cell division protein FtsL [Clostridium formicaceticum]AOY77435.1 hypothetical protein BJL90_17200 [Clostridium formicaceticum]ARE87989.1 Cell division protein FtsL [Clostridium formicaceticum]